MVMMMYCLLIIISFLWLWELKRSFLRVAFLPSKAIFCKTFVRNGEIKVSLLP